MQFYCTQCGKPQDGNEKTCSKCGAPFGGERWVLVMGVLLVVGLVYTRISDFAVVPYRQDQSPRLDFWGSDARNLTTEGDTRWVNYNTSHFSSRSTAS